MMKKLLRVVGHIYYQHFSTARVIILFYFFCIVIIFRYLFIIFLILFNRFELDQPSKWPSLMCIISNKSTNCWIKKLMPLPLGLLRTLFGKCKKNKNKGCKIYGNDFK